jgi:hypothetical protein
MEKEPGGGEKKIKFKRKMERKEMTVENKKEGESM